MSIDSRSPVTAGILVSVQIGRAAPLGPERVTSAFVKTCVDGAVAVGLLGLEGDEQADLTVHGGPDKAVYGYAQSNYPVWRAAFSEHLSLLVAGGFGENLTIDGFDENNVFLNDIVQIGTALLQVSQPRQPCYKFALRFADARLPRAMVKNGLCGWYYRVLKPGRLAAGDAVLLRERPCPQWPIHRVNRQITQRRGTASDRAEFAALPSGSRI